MKQPSTRQIQEQKGQTELRKDKTRMDGSNTITVITPHHFHRLTNGTNERFLGDNCCNHTQSDNTQTHLAFEEAAMVTSTGASTGGASRVKICSCSSVSPHRHDAAAPRIPRRASLVWRRKSLRASVHIFVLERARDGRTQQPRSIRTTQTVTESVGVRSRLFPRMAQRIQTYELTDNLRQ